MPVILLDGALPAPLAENPAPVAGQHTPGEWVLADTAGMGGVNLEPGQLAAICSSGYPSKVLAWVRDTSWPLGNDATEGKANAELIAAAPDLLAALKGLLWGLTDERWPQVKGPEHIALDRKRAFEAIAKAEGRGNG